MTKNIIGKSGDKSLIERFSIDARLVGLMSLIAFLGILLIGFTMIAGETLSAFRSYATMHTHWTEYRKEAVSSLQNYALSGNTKYYENYKRHIHTLNEAEKVRQELVKNNVDMPTVISRLQQFRFSDSEIANMVSMYNWLGWVKEMHQTMVIWEKSDREIVRLDSLANQINEAEVFTKAQSEKWVDEIHNIDDYLTQLQYRLAEELDQGTVRLKNIIFWSTLGVGLILLLMGIILSRRFLKSIRKWEETLKINFQQYRSLFDENPNAVYSFDLDGNFLEGNKSLLSMLSITQQKLEGNSFYDFIHESEKEKVRDRFRKAASGDPQTYETIGVDSYGNDFHVQVTNLPITVDEEIVGVYGLAQKIDERINAERKVQAQLKEKIVLLEEIHHRVKNNLAFVSGLLNLQEDHIDAENAKQKLVEAQNRIIAVAEIHEIFYDSDNFSNLPVTKYANKIFSRLFNTFDKKGKDISYSIDAPDIDLPMYKAIPFGLILNELITNSCKHAFENQSQGAINLLVKSVNGDVNIVYRDNGKGLPGDFNIETAAESSLGMRLIDTFLMQLDADYNLSTGAEKFSLEFSFKN